MTDRQQTIIEMAQILSKDCGHCEECNCVADNDINCTDYYYAKQLYNAGYRKVPENAVVLTQEEYDALLLEQNRLNKVVKHFQELIEDGKLVSSTQTRKETAKEILSEMFKQIKGYENIDIILNRIAKQFGVEVE